MKKYYGDEGARHYARKFYSSSTWTKRSKAYREKHPFCERCLAKGYLEPSACVHHRIHIDKENYKDYKILLNEENLEALCTNCHAKEHARHKAVFEFKEDGTLMETYEKEK